MTRQVRLDDDVVAMVEGRNPARLSLSGRTNELLRELLTAPAPAPARPPRLASGGASIPSSPPRLLPARRVRRRRQVCAHPDDLRRGLQCLGCGRTFTR